MCTRLMTAEQVCRRDSCAKEAAAQTKALWKAQCRWSVKMYRHDISLVLTAGVGAAASSPRCSEQRRHERLWWMLLGSEPAGGRDSTVHQSMHRCPDEPACVRTRFASAHHERFSGRCRNAPPHGALAPQAGCLQAMRACLDSIYILITNQCMPKPSRSPAGARTRPLWARWSRWGPPDLQRSDRSRPSDM